MYSCTCFLESIQYENIKKSKNEKYNIGKTVWYVALNTWFNNYLYFLLLFDKDTN